MSKLLLLISTLFTVIYGDSQWMQANGPGGAIIKFLEKSTSAIFAVTEDNGVYRSTNNGESWSLIQISGFKNDYISAIASIGLTVYAVYDGQKIFRSTDDGSTWVKACDSIRENMTIRVLITNKNYLFALCVDNGIFRSSDCGISWAPVNNGIDSVCSITSIAVVGESILACGTKHVASGLKHAVFRSLDDGTTWSPSDSGFPDQTSIYRLTVCDSNIIATSNKGLYKSGDSGRSWGFYNAGVLSGDTSAAKTVFADDIVISTDGNMLIANQITNFPNNKVFLSTDNGRLWSTLALPPVLIRNCMVKNDTLFIGSYYRGILRSTDSGKTWTSKNTGINGTAVSSIVGNGKSVFASCYGAGVFISNDNGANWSEFNSGLTALNINSLVINNDFIYACSPGNGIFRSSINNGNWSNVCSTSPVSSTRYMAVYGGKLFSSNDSGLCFSTDNGQHWTPVVGAPTNNAAITSFTICDTTLYAGSTTGLFYYNSESNTLSKVGSELANEAISCLASKGDLIFAGTSTKGCYVSMDKGRNWQHSSLPYKVRPNYSPGGYEVVPVTSISLNGKIAIAALPGPDIFSSIGGCYFSVDNGKSWTPIGPDTSWQTSVARLLIRGDTLLAASFRRGVWMRTLPKVSESAIGSSKSGLNLNPQVSLQLSRRASSGLCVTYNLPQPADVSVSIHTLNGSRVASIVNKKQPEGTYSYNWSCGKTAGLYVVCLKTGRKTLSRPIMFTP